MILAAGLGARLRPLSETLPKPLLPLWGRTLLGHAFDLLRRWGVREALVNLHHGAAAIEAAVEADPPAGLRLAFSREPVRLETGGALRRAARFFDDSPFWLLNADIAADLDPEPLRRALADPRVLAALWITDRAGPRTVRVEGPDRRIVSFRAERPGLPGTWTFCGLHLVRPEVLDFIPREERVSIVTAYMRAMAAGWRIRGVAQPGAFWADLGTPEQAIAAHVATRAAFQTGRAGARFYDASAERRATGGGWICAAPDVRIERGASVRESVLLAGAVVRRGARVERAVLGPGAEARGSVARLAVRAGPALAPRERAALRRAGFRPDRALLVALAPRGSDRAYFRLREGARRALLVRCGSARPENARWAGHARFLAQLGLRVPAVLAAWTARDGGPGLLVKDLGERTLGEEAARRSPAWAAGLLGRAVERLRRMHEEGGAAARRRGLALEPAFDEGVYAVERELFTGPLLARRLGWSAGRRTAVERELQAAEARLREAPAVLLHRDLQSANIIPAGREPAFIDFQGMRFGPAAYDLASLLYDPYADWPAPLRAALLRRYIARDPKRAAAVLELLPWAAVQRLTQAMGAYARMAALPGLEATARYLPVAAGRLRAVLGEAGLRLPRLRAALDAVIRAGP